jgi:hypothetical protein
MELYCMRHLAFLLLTALPVAAQEELPAGYPPKMGEVTGTMGEEVKLWETFDFSIGAFDASAWAGESFTADGIAAHVMAYPDGEPDTMAGRIYAEADFGPALRVGKGGKPRVEIYAEEDIDGPRLSSDGQNALFLIDSIGPKVDGSYARRVTGRIEARLCPIDWAGQECTDVALRFDTEMQLETSVTVQD